METPAPAATVGWDDLLGHPAVEERVVRGSGVGVMAVHGGLEAGTAEMAEALAAATGASLYVVAQPPALRWHAASHHLDPARSRLGRWLEGVDVALSLHGYGRVHRPRRVLLGGLNRDLAGRLARHLTPALPGYEVVTDLAEIPAGLRGLHPDNPVNRPARAGVQIELPASARGAAPPPPGEWGPAGVPARVVSALVAALADDALRPWQLR